MRRFLARPTRVPPALLLVMIGLMVTMFVLSAQNLHAAEGNTFPWLSAAIVIVLLMLLGLATFMRSVAWMYREYPDRMHEIDMARRTAIRKANGYFSKWRASLRHTPLPLVAVAFGWVFTGVMASGVVLTVMGILP